MSNRLRLATLLVAALVIAGCGSSRRSETTIRLTLLRHSFSTSEFAHVNVAGHRYLFLIDSGAARSVVRAGVANSLGLHLTDQRTTVPAIGCPVQTRYAAVSNWSLGSVPLPSRQVWIQSLNGIPARVDGQPIGGIIGNDVLASFGRVTLELQARQLVLGGAAPSHATAAVQLLHPDSGIELATSATVNGKHKRFLLDTGSSLSSIQPGVVTAAHLKPYGESVPIRGAGGCRTAVRAVAIYTWRVGQTAMPSTLAITGNVLPSRSPFHVDGIIGSDVMYIFDRVTLDYANAQVTFAGPRFKP